MTVALLVALGATGCVTSTIAQRRAERSAAYAALSPADKALIDKGKIREGMDADAVFIAWGAPTEVTDSEDTDGLVTRWDYWSKYNRTLPYWSIEPSPGPNGTMGPTVVRRYRTLPMRYLAAWVTFENGRVARWQRMPKPGW